MVLVTRMSKQCGDSIEVVRPLFQEEGDGSSPISPLLLRLTRIPVELAVRLNATWHSRLPIITNPHSGHTVCFGAEYTNRWYAVAIWTDPIARLFNGKGYLELRRFAIHAEAPKCTASRLLSLMRKQIINLFPEIIKLISYQDIDVHMGTIYKASGWTLADRHRGGKRTGTDQWSNHVRMRNSSQTITEARRWELDL